MAKDRCLWPIASKELNPTKHHVSELGPPPREPSGETAAWLPHEGSLT